MPDQSPMPVTLSPVETLLVEHWKKFGKSYLDAIDADDLDRQMRAQTQSELDAFRHDH